jgi:glycine/D-amino acid oxidase-like deaminating enzyme
MDLKSGYPFWAVSNGLMQPFAPLQADLRCEVLVIGGGITGALVADELARNGGHEVAVVEQRDIGWGSTAASTAMLQFEIDTHMLDLAEQYGEDNAAAAYLACAQAIDQLQALAAGLDLGQADVDFQPLQSLYYASRARDHKALADEFALRGRYGLQQRWLERDALQQQFGLQAPCAILSAKAARVDPYRLAHRLFERLAGMGVAVHDRTRIVELQRQAHQVRLLTAHGQHICAQHVVLANGYAAQHWLHQKVARNRSSYALITDPIDPALLGPLTDTMLWESARPYLYMRTTGDNRLLIGGEDDAVDIPAKRDALVQHKAGRLLRKVAGLFPQLPLEAAFSWAGTFAETRDGLPFFGPHAELGPRVHLAMAYGGNGITYSMTGAGLLRAGIEGRAHPLQALYGFGRLR